MTGSAIAANGLRKAYGDKVVLDGVDLAVDEGTIFSLLGPNGAGKTTVVRILSTLVGADAGDLRVGGHDLAADPQAVRAAIGVTGQFSAVDGLITGEENMLLMADLHHLPRREGRRVAAELEAVARAVSKPVSDTVREAIDLLIEDRRKDKAFRDRLRQMIEDERAILDRLAR